MYRPWYDQFIASSDSASGYYYWSQETRPARPVRLLRAVFLRSQHRRMVGRFYRDHIDMLEKRLSAYQHGGVN